LKVSWDAVKGATSKVRVSQKEEEKSVFSPLFERLQTTEPMSRVDRGDKTNVPFYSAYIYLLASYFVGVQLFSLRPEIFRGNFGFVVLAVCLPIIGMMGLHIMIQNKFGEKFVDIFSIRLPNNQYVYMKGLRSDDGTTEYTFEEITSEASHHMREGLTQIRELSDTSRRATENVR